MAIGAHPSPEPVRADTGSRHTGRLRVDDAEIHYEVSGRGPAIVFAHGLGGNHLSWWQQVGHFRSAYTCVTFAHRGFAPSRVDGGQPDPTRYAGDLAALIDRLELDRVHLVGQSMGGWTVVEYCLQQPRRVRSLVLSATVGSIAPERMASLDPDVLDSRLREAEQAVARCRAAGVHPAAGPRMAREQPALHLLYQHVDEYARDLDKELLRSRLRAMRVRAPSELAATGIPLLLVSPDDDIVIPPPALRALAREIPGSQLAELPRTGHSPYFESAPVFNARLGDFFAGIDRNH
ncbi:MAG: alpha/beta fold hydrolase [Pseudomonadota bacterium]